MTQAANFPSSRELFLLVREWANSLSSEDRMSDADIGRLIGFESARTSRWKLGQIAVCDASRLLVLSSALDIDIHLLSQVAAGYLGAKDALGILENSDNFVRFLGDNIMLPHDDLSLTLTDPEGTQSRITRRAMGHYHRTSRRSDRVVALETTGTRIVLLADSDSSTIDTLSNFTGGDTGIEGVVARSGADALVLAGEYKPDIIIYDLFLGQLDGFSAIRALASSQTTRASQIIASSLIINPEITRDALGCGATEVIQRPVRSRILSRLISRLRRGG